MQDLTGDAGGMDATPVASPVLSPDQATRVRRILSRSPWYVDDNAVLRITVTSSVVPVTVRVGWRRSIPEGQTPPATIPIVVSSAYTATSVDVDIGESLLFNVTAQVISGAPPVGATYVQVQLVQGKGGTAVVLGNLIARTVTQNQAAAWPGSPLVTSTDGEPYLRTITGTLPAAGVEFTETVPNGARWELVLVHAALTTSAVAIARTPNIQIQNGGLRLYQTVNTTIINNVSVGNYYLSQNLPYGQIAATLIFNFPIPQPTLMLAGTNFGSLTTNLQAGDQWDRPVYTVREWLEVN